MLDVVIQLRRPADYGPNEGARFEVHFEKARSLIGQDVDPVEASLTSDENGKQSWVWRPVADVVDRQVIELAGMGMSQADIAREIGVNRSTVLRQLRKAEDEGRYRPKKKISKFNGGAQ